MFDPWFRFTFGFLAQIIKLQHILTKKINILNFCHFLQPPPSGPQFWPIWPPCPHPMGHPPHPPTPLPSYMFLLPNESKKCAYSLKTGWQKKFWSWQVTTSFGLFRGHFGMLLRGGVPTGPFWEAQQWYFRVLPHPPRAQNRGTDDLKPRGHFDTPHHCILPLFSVVGSGNEWITKVATATTFCVQCTAFYCTSLYCTPLHYNLGKKYTDT